MSCQDTQIAASRHQTKPTRGPQIAPPNAQSERAADNIADAVISGHPVHLPASGFSGGRGAGMIHRQCADCAAGGAACSKCADDAKVMHLSRGPQACAGGSGAGVQAAAALSSGGEPMSPDMRSYFEPRFGADLSGVRLHREEPAARGINARAYAMGRDIAFAPRAFQPDTSDGRRLIAHEVAHTLQGDGQIHRQTEDEDEEAAPVPAPPTARTDTFEDDSGGGSTSFVEAVETAPVVVGDHIQGSVRRREIAPASDTQPEEDVSDMSAFVDFNTATCEITIPYRFGFRLEADDPNGVSCQGTALDAAQVNLNQIAQDYVDAVNAAMNDQFAIRLRDCDHGCAGQNIPIRISATRDDLDPDRVISVVTREGRGDAATLCVGSADPGFAVHEGGHQVLGRGDEYPERDADVLARVPRWGRRERVRNDYNVMGSRSRYGRFATFHERDFRHVLTFMRAAMPDCDAELRSVGDVVLDFRVFVGIGGGSLNGARGFAGTAGFDIGIPLSRGREWTLLVGAQADYLSQIPPAQRQFVLAGMRMGFERRFLGTQATGRLFGGGRFGVLYELETSTRPSFGTPGTTFGPQTAAFGEAQLGGGVMLHTGGGGGITADLNIRAGGELSGRDDAAYWINFGVMLGAQF